jgi:hypothetical protein
MNLSWLGDHSSLLLRLVMNAAVSGGGQCSGPPRSTKSQNDKKDQKDKEKQNDRYVCLI